MDQRSNQKVNEHLKKNRNGNIDMIKLIEAAAVVLKVSLYS